MSHNRSRRSRAARRWVIVIVLILWGLSGCRSTPPVPDEPPITERPEPVEVEVPDEPEEVVVEEEVEELDEEEEEEEEEEEIIEEVAPHVDARIRAAMSRVDDGDMDTAMQTLRDLIDEPDGGFLAAYNLGVIHDRRGDFEEAARRYTQVLRRQPDFTPALINLVRLYLRAGAVSDAQAVAERYAEERPDNMDHRAVRLEVWMHQERYADVVEGARDILRRDVRHVDAMIQMATAKFHQQRFELATAIINRALRLAPDRAESYYLLGLIALEQEEEERARRNLNQAITIQPRFPEARTLYALLLQETGNYDRAIAHLEAVVTDAPLFVEGWINLGNAYKANGDYGLAEDSYRDALDLDGENADALYNLGILYLETSVPGYETIDRYEKAIEAFQGFQRAASPRQASEANVAAFINEASAAIEREQHRQEVLRRQQATEQTPDEPEPDDSDDDDLDSE